LPVRKNTKGHGPKGGYHWGKAGTKTKLSKKKAAAVGRAAYANGYKGHKGKKK
jgi:hypothetical protein